MILKKGLEQLKNDLHVCGKKLLCFGAGNMPLYAEDMLIENGIARYIEVFIDNDLHKQGTVLSIDNRDISIVGISYLSDITVEQYILLIFVETFRAIEEQLNDLDFLCDLNYYVFPEINYDYYLKNRIFIPEKSDCRLLIPKKIHYFWFGGQKMDELQLRCIESWEKSCPDYEIKGWNEENYDIGKNDYIRSAYERGKWAYVTDYARMDILHQEGGFYFDTDVKLIKNINVFRQFEAILFFGEWPVPNSGAGCGAIPGHPIIRDIMQTREVCQFITNGEQDTNTNSNYEAQILKKYGFVMNHQTQYQQKMCLASSEYIAPVSVLGKNQYVTENTYGIHYCNNSWAGETRKEELKNSRR